MNLITPSASAHRKAAEILEKIEKLERQYTDLMGGKGVQGPLAVPRRFFPAAARPAEPKKRVMSEATKAKLSSIAKARWAKAQKTGAAPKHFFPAAAKPKKRVMSEATKAKLSAIAKTRWVKARKAGKKNL